MPRPMILFSRREVKIIKDRLMDTIKRLNQGRSNDIDAAKSHIASTLELVIDVENENE